jgi:hypothetical protein
VSEQDFKRALRDSMAVVTAPPPMNEAVVLDAAKRAVRRRRAMWASGASAVAVVALAVGVAFAAPGTDRSAPKVGAEVTSTTNPPPSSDDTKPNWPNGQTDATARSGPRYEQGVTLLNKVLEVVPPGFESPADLEGREGGLAGVPLRYHQATWGYDEQVEWWTYDATIPVTKADKVGSLHVSVSTAGNDLPGAQSCELSLPNGPVAGGSCQEVTVAGKTIVVVTAPAGVEATYRHPDGTMVSVRQSAVFEGYGYPPLSEVPFTSAQLAELATDPRFHLD